MRFYTPKQNYRGMNHERAQKIRELYLQRAATQKQLAERFGVSQGTISKIVSDQVWANERKV
jgi:transcriptional regulator with XRE-family HTH domain